jgi:hypothetical protein
MSQEPQSIDLLPTEKSLIDLSRLPRHTFNFVFDGYSLDMILDDAILVHYLDESEDGRTLLRGGLHVPLNADAKAWRIGQIILAGPRVKYVAKGDTIMFPNNLGVEIGGIQVTGYGKLEKGIFLNEQRIFGKVTPLKDERKSTNSKTDSTAKRLRD